MAKTVELIASSKKEYDALYAVGLLKVCFKDGEQQVIVTVPLPESADDGKPYSNDDLLGYLAQKWPVADFETLKAQKSKAHVALVGMAGPRDITLKVTAEHDGVKKGNSKNG